MNRRDMLKGMTATAGLGGLSVAKGAATCCPSGFAFNNDDFYVNGKFDVERGKDAIMAMCAYHGYNVFPGFREGLWVSDYGTGQYTKLGLAAYMFENNVKDRYMLMDLFMLPNQMLPEHWHLEGEGNPAKLEGWLVRYGKSYIVGIGKDNLKDHPEVQVPKCHMNGKTQTKHVVPTTKGQFVKLAKVLSRHWQFAGSEGAIVTESANVHTDSAVRHSDKAVNDNFLGV